MEKVRICLREWTRFPGGRHRIDGEHSGQEFREEFLESRVRNGTLIELDFNGIFTVGWSFLDETIGHYFEELGEVEFNERFSIIADDDPDILKEVETVFARRRKH